MLSEHQEQIIEALEATGVPNRSGNLFDVKANATRREILGTKRMIERFLAELDVDLSVQEILEILDEYE